MTSEQKPAIWVIDPQEVEAAALASEESGSPLGQSDIPEASSETARRCGRHRLSTRVDRAPLLRHRRRQHSCNTQLTGSRAGQMLSTRRPRPHIRGGRSQPTTGRRSTRASPSPPAGSDDCMCRLLLTAPQQGCARRSTATIGCNTARGGWAGTWPRHLLTGGLFTSYTNIKRQSCVVSSPIVV